MSCTYVACQSLDYTHLQCENEKFPGRDNIIACPSYSKVFSSFYKMTFVSSYSGNPWLCIRAGWLAACLAIRLHHLSSQGQQQDMKAGCYNHWNLGNNKGTTRSRRQIKDGGQAKIGLNYTTCPCTVLIFFSMDFLPPGLSPLCLIQAWASTEANKLCFYWIPLPMVDPWPHHTWAPH